jgi:hypothetical protein
VAPKPAEPAKPRVAAKAPSKAPAKAKASAPSQRVEAAAKPPAVTNVA